MSAPQPPTADEPFRPPVGPPVDPALAGPPEQMRPTPPDDPTPGERRSSPEGRPMRELRTSRPSRRTPGTWIALGLSVALVAAAGGVAWWLTRADGDSSTVVAPSTAPPAVTASSAPVSSIATTVPGASAAPTTATPTTRPVAPAAPVVDVGGGVGFALPPGFTQQSVPPGIEITDGTVRLYAQVSARAAGEDPVVALQEYVNSFDALYPSAAYSQVVPRPADTSGAAPIDGSSVHYRVLAADGTGYVGVVEVIRRADGLVSLTDRYVTTDAATATDAAASSADATDDATSRAAPAIDELYRSLSAAPSVGPEAALGPLPLTRLSSVHPAYVLDGVVAVMAPVGWIDDGSFPGGVSLRHPAGERVVVERLADTTDPVTAETQSVAAVQRVVPGAVLTPFAPTGERESIAIRWWDASFVATGADGRALEGTVRVWFDAARSQVFHAVLVRVSGQLPQPGHESFLLQQVATALQQPR